MSEKKTKTLSVGSITKGQYGPFLSLDSSIKEVTFKREYDVEGETITELLTVPVNEKGYLNAMNIQKVADSIEFKVGKGWMTEEVGEKIIANAKEYGTTSYVTCKVESK